MQTIAERIIQIIGDYQNNEMSVGHILKWVEQFEEADRKFILEELAVIFESTYVSKSKTIDLIKGYIVYWTNHFQYTSVREFLNYTVFLDVQAEEKSQKELLSLLGTVISETYGITLGECGKQIKHYIYLDDVLSTGTTVYRQLADWLDSSNNINIHHSNFQYIKDNGLSLHVCLLCAHDLGKSNAEFRLIKKFGNDLKKYVKYHYYYLIENNIKAYNPKLNHLLPVENQGADAQQYLASLNFATMNEDRAYRRSSQPAIETLFSSPASRIRLENIFLKKGIEILSRVQDLRVQQMRPLGYTVKSHKTFGLGTLFFTYRNIPNNCPLVFWWANNHWRPLFILKNRGGK